MATTVWKVSLLALAILLCIGFLPVASAAASGDLGLTFAHASPGLVQRGLQLNGDPLILSVESNGLGGTVSSAAVNLVDLLFAKFYDPVADAEKDAGADTPMMRVYRIDGVDAYLMETGSRWDQNVYREAVGHQLVRGDAVPTDRWQVEVVDAGIATGEFDLPVTAAGRVGQIGAASIHLAIVDDSSPPSLVVTAGCPTRAAAARPGDAVDIEARTTDDLTGVFCVRLDREGAVALFGEDIEMDLAPEKDSATWTARNRVAAGVLPGTYPVDVVALDRAGNETVRTVDVTVAEQSASFRIDLHPGWNLISVPRALASPVVEDVFSGLDVDRVETVVGGQQMEAARIEPGRGYLVHSAGDATRFVDLAERDLSASPLSVDLPQGWNLVGYASETLDPSLPLTFYLGEDLKGSWSIVVNEDGAEARARSTTPYVWATDGFPTNTGEASMEDTANLPVFELGQAYWIYMTEDGVLMP